MLPPVNQGTWDCEQVEYRSLARALMLAALTMTVPAALGLVPLHLPTEMRLR